MSIFYNQGRRCFSTRIVLISAAAVDRLGIVETVPEQVITSSLVVIGGFVLRRKVFLTHHRVNVPGEQSASIFLFC
jgi:hypothetical protein